MTTPSATVVALIGWPWVVAAVVLRMIRACLQVLLEAGNELVFAYRWRLFAQRLDSVLHENTKTRTL